MLWMNGVLSVRILSWHLESPPQVLNLNQGVALRSWKGLVHSNPHSS